MHIPDGYLSMEVCAATTAAGAAAAVCALRRTRSELARPRVPAAALTGAFIFAAQMLNFPIAGGTSGHFLGSALAAILFGPWAAAAIMTAVLIIQAVLFHDGGITALGANILCTAVIGSFVGHGSYRAALRLMKGRLRAAASFAAAWVSIVAAACGVALLLALSGAAPLPAVLGAMVGWHALIGIGEGLITTAAVLCLTERGVSRAIREDALRGGAPA
ncbi:MAG: cobalamin biosynthesis protein CbiM [Thermobacillus sp. ZCTH02-B1]|uniref:energy-coupling factor ABC transporter permease n=1 Tax=Thermobacillus sp. ZCTH02-B1 TaxID=1858795 RepID=UPI000B584FF6|nr:energy-coupling factor ABC transporter permease [Thermobacillus sp. ZCTH02-B1]OUM95540.1 MAG: cobalamin biosynthesis protein CbiM [Thermobacillus sp. ZCTH02-B1]